jgi:tetratricopeptide (TPR) repeat protein
LGRRAANATTISLRPLTDADTARLVAALLDRAVLPADTQAALLERASGNPLYAEEVCRTLVEQGEFELDHLGSIQALIAARLDRLTVEHKQLLQDAAVIGKVFWAGALTSMGDRDAATVRAGLHDLQRRELVRPTRSSTMKDDTEYAFWHGLTRDVAYGQLPRAARATKHRAAAAWLERAAGNRIADQAEVLAHHYDQALTNARAARLPGQAAELEGASLRFLMLAGDRALALDVARADDYYQRALRLAPAGHPERAGILAKAAEVAKHAGRMAEAEQTYEDAIAAFRVRGDLVGTGGAMVRSAVVLWLRGEPARSRELLASAIELLEGGPPGPELAGAYEQMAADVLTHGRPAEALVWVAKAIDLADRVGAEDTRQLALQFRGGARFMGGDVGGMDDLREAVQLGLRLGLGPATALAYYNFADAVFMLDGPAAALETYRAGRVLCRQRGITELGVALEEGILRCLVELGSWDDAMPIADKLITWYQARGGHYFDVAIQSMKADILVHRGRVAEALPLTERFLPRAREIGDLQVVVQALPVAALVAQADGQLDAAIRLVEEFERVTREGPGPYRAEPLPRLLRVCGDAGELSLAERLLEVEAHTIRHQHCLVAARAILAEAHGDLEQASSWYAEAVERWSGYGALLEHGQALLGLGRCQVGMGRPAARDRLMQASAIFGRLAARPLLAAADGWLRRAHQKRRPT